MLVMSAGLAVGLLAGCSSGGEDSAGTAARPQTQTPANAPGVRPAEQQGGDKAVNASADDDLSRLDSSAAQRNSLSGGKPMPPKEAKPKKPVSKANLLARDRKLARTASLKLRVPNLDEAAADARQAAEHVGGFTGSETTRKTSVRMTLVVPGDKLDAVMADLEDLGARMDRKISIDDVTDAVVDVDSRVKSQRRSVIRARALLDRANSISEIVRVEEELADREEELESLVARQEALRGQVAMAPITLALLPTKPKPKPEKSDDDEETGFLAGLSGGWDAFVKVLSGLALAAGAAAPFVLVFGLPALALLWAWRRRKRKPAPPVPAES